MLRQMPDKMDMGDAVFIADLHEAGRFAGREGVIYGHTKPSHFARGPDHRCAEGSEEDLLGQVSSRTPEKHGVVRSTPREALSRAPRRI